MKKKLLRIFFAFIMFFSVLPTAHIYNNDEKIIEAAYTVKGYAYFEKPSSWTSGGVMFMIGHNSWSQGYKMTNISGTNIYYYNQSSNWDNATDIAFVDNNGSWGGSSEKISSRVNGKKNYIINEGTWKLQSGYNIFTIEPSYDGSYGGSYSNLNISIKTSANTGGTAYVNGYGFTSATAASAAGSSKTSANIIKYTNATLTATPNTGYTFDGWYDNTNYTGTALSKNTSYTIENVTDAKTYYAKFSPIKSVVTLNNQNATTTGTTSVTGTYASAMPSITIPTKTGYTFGGYYTATGGSGTQYYNANGTSAKNWDKTSATTLYAKWTPINYTISYNLDDGSVSSTNPTSYNIETATFTLNNPTKIGYTFTGWTGSNGSTPQTSVSIAKGSTGNKSYTANWSVNTYNITFNLDGGIDGTTDTTVAYDAPLDKINVPTKEGKIFSGYYTGRDGSGTQYYDSEGNGIKNWNIAANTELFAYWVDPVSHNLTLHLNGGLYLGNTGEYIFEVLETLQYNLPNPSRNGYEFVGWYKTSNYVDDSKINPSDKVPKVGAGNLDSYDIYAKWTAINYTIVFEEMGGSEVENITQGYETIVVKPEDPTKTGYTFTGWYTDENCTEIYEFTTMPLNGIKLYAGWEGAKYTVIFDPNNGKVNPTEKEVTFGETYGELPIPTKTGYNFVGWNDSKNGTIAEYFDTTEVTLPNNHTLYAVWEAKTYTISFNSNGGSDVADIIVKFNTQYGTLPTPTKTGYEFAGWFTEMNGGTEVKNNNKHVIDSGRTLYAHWDLVEYNIEYVIQMDNVSVDNIMSYNVEDEDFELNNPSKYGAEFIGWTIGDDTTPSTSLIIDTSQAKDLTITAHWRGTITFHIDGEAYNQAKYGWDGTIDKESLYIFGSSGTYHNINWSNDYNNVNSQTRFVYDADKKEHTYVVTLSTIDYEDDKKFVDITGVIFYFFQNTEMKQTKDINLDSPLNINNIGGHYELIMPNSFTGSGNPWKIDNITIAKMTCVTYMLPDGITIIGEDYYTAPKAEYRPIFVEKEGFKLEGWYTDTSLTNFFESGTETLDSNGLTLYAKYVEVEDFYLYIDAREVINASDATTNWTPTHVYLWSNYFANHNNGVWPGDNNADTVISLGNGMYQIKVDASKSYDHLILNDGGTKKTEDITLSPSNVYYIINEEYEYLEFDKQYRFTTTVEENLENLMGVQKVGNTNNFRFSASLPTGLNIDTKVDKNFGYKFIFIKEDNTSYIGYWSFSTSNRLDALRLDELYKSKALDPESTYDGFYALTLNSSASFDYKDYVRVVVVACYKENNSNNTNVIKAQEYIINVDGDNVTLSQVRR